MAVPAVTWVCCKTSRSVSPRGAGLTVGAPEDGVLGDDVWACEEPQAVSKPAAAAMEAAPSK
jgi:hypothetical protein